MQELEKKLEKKADEKKKQRNLSYDGVERNGVVRDVLLQEMLHPASKGQLPGSKVPLGSKVRVLCRACWRALKQDSKARESIQQ